MENNEINIPTSCNNYYKAILTGVSIVALTASTAYLFIQNKKQEKLLLEHTRYIEALRSNIDRGHFTDNFNSYLNSVLNDGVTSFNKFFSNIEDQISLLGHSMYSDSFYKNINIVSNQKEFIVTAALPGYSKDEITINLLGSNLEISAKHPASVISDNDTNEENRSKKTEKECKYNVTVPTNIDINNINTQLNNGLLTVKFLKRTDQTDIAPKTILID